MLEFLSYVPVIQLQRLNTNFNSKNYRHGDKIMPTSGIMQPFGCIATPDHGPRSKQCLYHQVLRLSKLYAAGGAW